jgi:hypothetical protein
MGLQARQVLEDCRHALSELNSLPYKIDRKRNRNLCACVTKVHQQKIIDEHEPEIYHQFIRVYRNKLLHEYKFDAGQNIVVNPGTIHVDLGTGEQKSENYPNNIDYIISEGPYKGRDARELAHEAIDWWEECITEIEEKYRKFNKEKQNYANNNH